VSELILVHGVGNLQRLHLELKRGEYSPSPVKRIEIPKSNGKMRPLGIPTVKDRIVQQAILNIIQPIFESDFHPQSYGYRPYKSCHKAVAKAHQLMECDIHKRKPSVSDKSEPPSLEGKVFFVSIYKGDVRRTEGYQMANNEKKLTQLELKKWCKSCNLRLQT